MLFESNLQPIKDLKERNLAFDNLSAEEQRKEIAWDVLQLTLSEKLIGSSGCYWDSKLRAIAETSSDSSELQCTFEKWDLPTCQVCARGAMMLSQIRLNNNVNIMEPNFHLGYEGNVKGFVMKDYYLMEKEYERSQFLHPYHSNSTEKLQNICLNVIANGNFNLSDKTDYLENFLKEK